MFPPADPGERFDLYPPLPYFASHQLLSKENIDGPEEKREIYSTKLKTCNGNYFKNMEALISRCRFKRKVFFGKNK